MKKLIVLLLLTFSKPVTAIQISSENAHQIAKKIWKNECAGSIAGLTSWNKGENFASLGIGHFIWYPPGKKERFQESFPELLSFLEKQGVTVPTFLKNAQGCLWNSRDEFHAALASSEMEVLRNFLFNTKDLQAIFIAQRLEKSFPGIVKDLPPAEKQQITHIFLGLEKDPKGLYALIDYLNFKGAGTNITESYQGQGWGLLQVLQGIPVDSNNILADFVVSAKNVLQQRVQHAPPERNEQRWLKGWENRIDTYLQ